MSSEMKYIIIDGSMCEMPFIFPTLVDHDVMAKMVSNVGKPVSAGFVDIDADGIYAHGKSTSLGIKSRPFDTEVIERHMGIPS